MGGEWSNHRLSDVIDLIGGGTPKRSRSDYWGGDIPWLSVKDFNDDYRYVYSAEETITEYGLNNSSTKILEKGEIIISARGTVGALAQLARPMAFNQSCYGIRAKKEFTFNDYLYYLLRYTVENLQRITHGAVFDTITRETFQHVDISLPPITEQRAIAHILGTLDDKIELNRQMNRTLEAMAQALFKSFFLDFDPVVVNALRAGNPIPEKFAQRAAHYRDNPDALRLPEDTLRQFPDRFQDSELGPIPEGWEVGILADLAELNADSWNQKTLPDEILYVDLSNTKFGIIESVKTFNKQDAPSRARRILKPGDTIMGVVRPANKSYAMVGETPNILTGSTGFAVLSPKSAVFREYVYLQATNEENITRLARLADGAAYPAVRPNVVADTKCVISDEQVLKLFHEATVDLYDKFHENNSESETLSTLRDTLLPKLISGELRVPDAEKLLEGVE